MRRRLHRAWGLLALMASAAAPLTACADTLRCNGYIADVGDSRLSVLYKCGEPVLKDAHCAPLYSSPLDSTRAVPVPPLLFGGLPCLVVDEWLYDRGPGNLMATVRFQSGVVQSIRYSRVPQ